MENLKLFESESQYLSFKNSNNYIEPNVSLIDNENIIHYNKCISPVVNIKEFTFGNPGNSTNTFKTYYFNEGMTWGEWLESEYNTSGFTYSSKYGISAHTSHTVEVVKLTDYVEARFYETTSLW